MTPKYGLRHTSRFGHSWSSVGICRYCNWNFVVKWDFVVIWAFVVIRAFASKWAFVVCSTQSFSTSTIPQKSLSPFSIYAHCCRLSWTTHSRFFSPAWPVLPVHGWLTQCTLERVTNLCKEGMFVCSFNVLCPKDDCSIWHVTSETLLGAFSL